MAKSEGVQNPRDLYDDTASVQDRTVGTGIVKPELAERFGAGGYVGRASGRPFDVRRTFPYPPYDALAFEVGTPLTLIPLAPSARIKALAARPVPRPSTWPGLTNFRA